MRKLIHANFVRMVRGKIFWIIEAALAGYAVFAYASVAGNIKRGLGIPDSFLFVFFNEMLAMGAVMALFTILFLGVEYSNGVIRNKISTGHRRRRQKGIEPFIDYPLRPGYITRIRDSFLDLHFPFLRGHGSAPNFRLRQIPEDLHDQNKKCKHQHETHRSNPHTMVIQHNDQRKNRRIAQYDQQTADDTP